MMVENGMDGDSERDGVVVEVVEKRLAMRESKTAMQRRGHLR